MIKSIFRISTAATIIFFILVALFFTCSTAKAQTTTYVINPEERINCDSVTLAKQCIKNRNRIVGKDNKSQKDVWQSLRGSYFIIIIPRSGGCAYKKYLKPS